MKKMNKQIFFIILGIFFISLTSAIDVTAGECSIINFPNEDNVSIDIVGNSSNMDGFTWNKNGTIIEYCFDLNYQPDNFTIRWFNEEEVSVSSGGSQRSRYSSSSQTKVIENETEFNNQTDNEIIEEEKEETIIEVRKPLSVSVKVLLVFLVFVSLQLLLRRIKVRKAERRLKENE